MPQIDVPFLPGDKVRVKATSHEAAVREITVGCGGKTVKAEIDGVAFSYYADELEAVKPVIEWVLQDDHWENYEIGWDAYENGALQFCSAYVGTFSDPRAVAEETQALWNERAASNEREGK